MPKLLLINLVWAEIELDIAVLDGVRLNWIAVFASSYHVDQIVLTSDFICKETNTANQFTLSPSKCNIIEFDPWAN